MRHAPASSPPLLRRALFAASALALTASAVAAHTNDPGYFAYDGGAQMLGSGNGGVVPVFDAPTTSLSFEGISHYDVAAFGRNFIPPDTNGAVGATQFMETTNGAYAVYDKATGTRTSLVSDVAFWAAAGQVGANGDSRVMFDKRSQRWIVESFGASISDIQIAVSTTSDALGPWKSTKFTGNPGGIADYPTLAMDGQAVYIGTNDFAGTSGNPFQGTTLNVISRNDLFGAGAPTTASLKQFFTPYPGADRGFAIQGVNNEHGTDVGKIIAVSNTASDLVRYDVINPGTPGATETASKLLGTKAYDTNNPGRQPDGSRVIDTLDDRISSAAWEQNGKIYAVHTVTPTGTQYTAIVLTVSDATTNKLIQQITIGSPGFDYYQGSVAVNQSGQVVVGYDLSGLGGAGKVSVYAQALSPYMGGALRFTGRLLLHASTVDDYHNGSLDGQPASGRQRWGDYAQVTVDPTNDQSFWVIGQFAREWNNAEDGHPAGTGGSRWGTWITDITLTSTGAPTPVVLGPGAPSAPVPEPATWVMLLLGFGGLGAAARRSRRHAAVGVA